MDVKFINPFLTATKNVIKTMANIDFKSGELRLKQGNKTYGAVTGIIGMASEHVSGNLTVSFQKDCILYIVSKMFLEDMKDEVDRDVVDAVGEITNIICGGAKAKLSEQNIKFDLATPTIIKGEGVGLSAYSEFPTVVIPFETKHGGFVVEANFESK